MCGRFTLTDPDPRILRMRFDLAQPVEVEVERRYNIAPTDPVLAIRERDGARELGRLRWGLVPPGTTPAKLGRPLINARAETVHNQGAFKEAFRERRCLVPADGFYEWAETETGKQPVWITLPGAELFAFAGLWSRARQPDGGELHSCTIVTCEPTDQLRPIHDRMPVILPREAEGEWLRPGAPADALRELLAPGPPKLEVREVSTSVNDVAEDGPHLLERPLKLF